VSKRGAVRDVGEKEMLVDWGPEWKKRRKDAPIYKKKRGTGPSQTPGENRRVFVRDGRGQTGPASWATALAADFTEELRGKNRERTVSMARINASGV